MYIEFHLQFLRSAHLYWTQRASTWYQLRWASRDVTVASRDVTDV